MSNTLRYIGCAPLMQLERLYRDKYSGYEADLRYQPEALNALRFQVDIDVPHMIAIDESLKSQLSAAADRGLRQMMRECARIVEDARPPATEGK